jgi:hypothetical protein
MAILNSRFASYSIVILNSTIEMAVCNRITRGLRAGAEEENRRV